MTGDFIIQEWQMLHDTYLTYFGLGPVAMLLLPLVTIFCIWKIGKEIAKQWKWMIVLLAGYTGLSVYFVFQNLPLLIVIVPILGMLLFCAWKICKGKNVVSFGICAAILLYVLVTGFYWDRSWVPPERKNLSVVTVQGKQIPLEHTWILKIPPQVFSRLDLYPKDARYLTGPKKQVLFINADATCPVTKQFGEELSKMAQTPEFSKYYDLTKIPFGDPCKVEADTYYCPRWWAMRYCGNACIINPKTQEVIADFSQEIGQFSIILDAYVNWDEEPLLQ